MGDDHMCRFDLLRSKCLLYSVIGCFILAIISLILYLGCRFRGRKTSKGDLLLDPKRSLSGSFGAVSSNNSHVSNNSNSGFSGSSVTN